MISTLKDIETIIDKMAAAQKKLRINHMKKSELKQMIREEIKKISTIKESFGSSIIQNLRYAGKKGDQAQFIRQMDLQWDKITDQDLVKITPQEARTKNHEDSVIFWMSGAQPIALSFGKSVWFDKDASNWGRYKKPVRSSKQLADESEFCIAIPKDIIAKYGSVGIQNDRYLTRRDATAFKQDRDIKNANLLRYKQIIAKKKSENSDIDNKIKAIMSVYQNRFEDLTKNLEWLKVRNLGEEIKKLMDMYSRYAYISTDLKNGSAYEHQTVEMSKIINDVNKLYSQLLNK
jgi:hypothetical protein